MTPPATTSHHSGLIPAAQGRPADDPIFQLNAEAQRRARAQESIVNATLGALMEDDGSLAILPSMVEALAQVDAKAAAAYAPILGDAPFLRAVVTDACAGHALAQQAVAAATPGGTGALNLALQCFLEPAQALLTTSFYWGPYHTLAAHNRRAVETFEMFDGAGRFNLAAFESALAGQLARQGRALVFLNTPCHNPTGYSLDEREWSALAEIVRRAGERAPVTLLLDMAYARFGSPAAQRWIEHAERMLPSATVLVAWTASKSFAQYGARVGALIALHTADEERARIQNALAYACRGTWSNCNHAGLLAVTQLLSDPERRARVERERARLVGLLEERVAVFNVEARRAGLSYPRYEGGFFVSVFTPQAERAAAAMRDEGVFVVPIAGALRAALCSTPARDVPRLVRALQAGVARAAGG